VIRSSQLEKRPAIMPQPTTAKKHLSNVVKAADRDDLWCKPKLCQLRTPLVRNERLFLLYVIHIKFGNSNRLTFWPHLVA